MPLFQRLRECADELAHVTLHRLAGPLPALTITRPDGAPYLIRALVCRLPGGRRIYLHWFIGDDDADLYHDHPCRFVTLILAGSYTEHTVHDHAGVPTVRSRTLRPGRVNIIGPNRRHRVTLETSASGRRTAWTLVYRGRNRKLWSLRQYRRGHMGLWTHRDQLMQPGSADAFRDAPSFADQRFGLVLLRQMEMEEAARHVA